MSTLRRRSSVKWRSHDESVLPLFVAEMDFPLAPVIREALHTAVDLGDTGYVRADGAGVPEAFAAFARDRWDWAVDPAMMRTTTDVSVVVVETLRRLTGDGDGVVITPPVYPPFVDLVTEAGRAVVPVPLRPTDGGHELDLDGIEAALADGARAVLLCNPHNPLGLVHSRQSLLELSRIVARHGAVVVSDEIHAPLTHHGVTFTPYLSVSPEAREHGVAAESGSKAFNLAGLKCALFVAASPTMAQMIAELPWEISGRTGLFGAIGAREGFRNGREWLDEVITTIQDNIDLLEQQLVRKLPAVRMIRPEAGYLVWLDMRELGWGEDPADRALTEGAVALVRGLDFGAEGAGWARMNLACAPETVVEAVDRLARAAG